MPMFDYPVAPDLLTHAGLFPDRDALFKAGVRSPWQNDCALRISVAAHRCQREPLSVARAAQLAGVSFDEMKSALAARGVPLRLGNESVEDLLDDAQSLREGP